MHTVYLHFFLYDFIKCRDTYSSSKDFFIYTYLLPKKLMLQRVERFLLRGLCINVLILNRFLG